MFPVPAECEAIRLEPQTRRQPDKIIVAEPDKVIDAL